MKPESRPAAGEHCSTTERFDRNAVHEGDPNPRHRLYLITDLVLVIHWGASGNG